MDLLLAIVGALLVGIVMLDVFLTVLFPASGHGPVRKPVALAVWKLFRLLAARMSGQRRRNVLSYSGPVVISATLVAWLVLLVVGWSLVYLPALGTGIQASDGGTDRSWPTALYFSGFNLTTLGVGDLAPETAAYRLLTVVQAASGFTFFSMVITYFLSVYSTLPARNAYAQAQHHLTGGTGDAAELLVGLARGRDLEIVHTQLGREADFLRSTFQAHRFYPVLRYFQYREPCYALPRILLIALDTATLLRTAVDPVRYADLAGSRAVSGLLDTAMALLDELMPEVRAPAPTRHQHARWRLRYAAAIARLSKAGVAVRTDADDGAEEYVMLRSKWDRPLRDLADVMLYEWDVIETYAGDDAGGAAGNGRG